MRNRCEKHQKNEHGRSMELCKKTHIQKNKRRILKNKTETWQTIHGEIKCRRPSIKTNFYHDEQHNPVAIMHIAEETCEQIEIKNNNA